MSFEIFATAPPGLEAVLGAEMAAEGFKDPKVSPGGVAVQGDWSDVWRANLRLRGATRILARIGGFPAFHLAQLDKRSKRFDWRAVLRPDIPVKVEVATNKRSKIYHARAAAQRIEGGLAAAGVPISSEAEITLKVRIDDNFVTFSLDTSGESLHRRGYKQAVAKAPLRETLASLMLRQCGYTGNEPVLDPMCGSGTIPIEAALWAKGADPGGLRGFAFEQFASFDEEAYAALRRVPGQTPLRVFGSDRDAGAVRMATENAARAGVEDIVAFSTSSVADLVPPQGPPGLIMVNPPYGTRIGNKKPLYGLYATLGSRLKAFCGWRLGLVTSEAELARATGLAVTSGPPIPHGGLKVRFWQANL